MKDKLEPFTYEWFKSLTDKELSDIGYMEAMVEKKDTSWLQKKQLVSNLLAALAGRVQDYES